MPTMARLRTLFVPACIGLFFLVAAGWYYSFWIPTRHRYLDDRNFRVLRTLSEQIRLSVDNFDRMLDHAADSGIASINLKEYLVNVAPQLEGLHQKDAEAVTRNDFGDPPRVAVAADDGTHYLYMAFQRDVKGASIKYAVRSDLHKLVSRLLPPDNRNPFDDVLLAQNDGSVIFQKSTPGIEVARIDVFEDENNAPAKLEGAKTEKPSGSTEEHARAAERKQLWQSSSLRMVTLAGAQYRLYSQPLRLSFPPIAAEAGARENPPPSLGEQWILCGLVRADNFRAEGQWMSYTYILWFLGAILLAVAAYPFLRLRLSSQTERLRPRDVVSTALLSCFATTVVTFILLDLYYGRDQCEQSGERRADRQMAKLASAIDFNFGTEAKHAFNQLIALSQIPELRPELRRARMRLNDRPRLSDDGKNCKPASACLVQILKDAKNCEPASACRVQIPKDGLRDYPFLQYISWSDTNADQQIKWTTRSKVTPFINLKNESYYSDVQKALSDLDRARRDHDYTPSAPFQGIGSQYSSNTGKNITIFWKLMDVDGNPVSKGSKEKDVFCVSLVSNPISVTDSILPAGFEFAVVKNDGTVVFHSDATRNLRENFFAETDQDQDLHSRVSMRVEGPLVTNYMGKRHRLYVKPMLSSAEQNWSVIIFRDARLEETLNLEILSLSSVMFLIYAASIALVLLLAHWFGLGRDRGMWLWPDSRQASTYQALMATNGVFALALCFLPLLRSFWMLFSAAVFIPICAMLVNFFFLRRRADSTPLEGSSENRVSRWQFTYVFTCAILLVVIAVLPCVSFVKVACDFEHKLFIERSQLGLAAALEDRMANVRKRCEKVDLGSYAGQILAEVGIGDPTYPAANKGNSQQATAGPIFSYHETLHTTIYSGGDCDTANRMGTADTRPLTEWQSSAEWLLSKLSPSYNDLAADDHYLAQAKSSDQRCWFYAAKDDREQVALTTKGSGGKERTIVSVWTPLHIPRSDGLWWVGASLFLGILFRLVGFTLRAIFLLDLGGDHADPGYAADLLSHDSLNADPKTNLLVIDSGSSKTLANLCANNNWIEARDMEDMVKLPQQSAMASNGSVVPISDRDPVERIVCHKHVVLLHGVEKVLHNPVTSQKSRLVVQEVLRRLNKSVILSTVEDPVANSCDGEMKHWRALLRSFIRVELGSRQAHQPGRTRPPYERQVMTDPYHRWLFDQRSESEKLLLVQLAQEGLVNPNNRGGAEELIRKGLIVRRSGLLEIRSAEFAKFLKVAVPLSTTKRWEKKGAGITAASLRISLLVMGAAVVTFLIYTQGEVFNTWVTYATGFAASVPTFLHLFRLFRDGKAAEPA